MAVVFVESKYILPNDMTHTTEKYFFAYLIMVKNEKNIIEKTVSFIYKNNMQIKREKDLSTFHKIDLPLLQFFNTISYCKQLVLAYFTDNFAYRRLESDISCCNNCLYSSFESVNMEKDSGISKWKLHDVTMRHSL